MNQAFIRDSIGSKVLHLTVDTTPDGFMSIQAEHRKIFMLMLRHYDPATGRADFSLAPGNGVVFYSTPGADPWKDRIKQWAIDRNLIEGSRPWKQLVKLEEECDELAHAIADRDIPGTVNEDGNIAEIKDAIGDIQVVLAVMCAQLGIDVDECREIAWEAIKDRKGKMVDGVFVKEVQGD